MVERCSTCQENRRTNPRPDLHLRGIPQYPFQSVGTDLFELEGKNYLLTVDYFSKWVNISELQATRAADVIAALNYQFADYGIPEELYSDNGPQFANAEFRSFGQRMGFKPLTSSPRYPASNGQAERSIQTAKSSMAKMFREGRTLPDVLRVLRNTPIGRGLPSPATLLQGRQLRTQLAINRDAYLPQPVDVQDIRSKLERRQADQAFYSTRGRVTAPTLQPGEHVRIQHGEKWIPGRVMQHHPEPQSYLVETSAGRILRRTRTHLNKTQEAWQDTPVTSAPVPPDDHPAKETTAHTPGNTKAETNPSSSSPKATISTHGLPEAQGQSPRKTRSGRAIQQPKSLDDY